MIFGLLVGFIAGCVTCVIIIKLVEPQVAKRRFPPLRGEAQRPTGRLPKGVKRGQRPDVRRIVLRPTNIDQPPSRITQALFRQRPTRKLNEDD